MAQPPTHSNDETNANKAQPEAFNFMKSFRPVYYFSRLIGLMPFTINCDSNGEVQRSAITKSDGVWLVISISIYSLIPFYIKVVPGPVFVVILGHIFAIFGSVYSVLTIVVDMCNRSKFIEILRRITAFDKMVRCTNVHLNYLVQHFFKFRVLFLFDLDDQCGDGFQLQTKIPTKLLVLLTSNINGIHFYEDNKRC